MSLAGQVVFRLAILLVIAGPTIAERRVAADRSAGLTILEAALSAAESLDNPADRIDATDKVATAMARAGHFREAVHAAEMIGPRDRKEHLLLVVAESQARAGDIEGSLQIVRKTGDVVSDRESLLIHKAQVYAGIVELRARGGDLVGARQLAGELPGAAQHFGYWAIARAQADSGDLAGAVGTLKSFEGGRLGDQSWLLIAQAQLKAGDELGPLQIAEQLQDAARQTAKSLPKGVPNYTNHSRDMILEGIAVTQARKGGYMKAAETVGSVSSSYERTRTLAAIATIAARADDRVVARAIIQKAFDSAGADGIRDFALMDIATAQALAGDSAAASKNFRQSFDQVEGNNQSAVVYAQAQAGDVEGAIQNARTITFLPGRAHAMARVADARLDGGDSTGAFVTAREIADEDLRVAALARIAEAQARSGNAQDARVTLREADQWARAQTGETLTAIARTRSLLDAAAEVRNWADRQPTHRRKIDALLGLAQGLAPRT